ncbi:MAG: N-acetyltransferase family protein [Actinomycetota bacterium]
MVEIRRLSKAETEKFLEFMDGPGFKTNPDWGACYCQFYLDDHNEINPEQTGASENRKKACDRIASGAMRGYLAFEGDRTIGWVAANAAKNFPGFPEASESTARILCFVIDQDFQRQGVATKLLNYALEDLPKQGFDLVEAAPKTQSEVSSRSYRGPISMYLKAGFELVGPLDEHSVIVRRKLSA